MFGAAGSQLGRWMISVQTGFWLAFGLIYLAIGIAFFFKRGSFLRQRIRLAPGQWALARTPALAGLAFGLNIPACAAPILFGLPGLAATTGAAITGFTMMFIFGVALSSPLALFLLSPGIATFFEEWAERLKGRRWVPVVVFIVLGLWSVWFGLNVDPKDWAGV